MKKKHLQKIGIDPHQDNVTNTIKYGRELENELKRNSMKPQKDTPILNYIKLNEKIIIFLAAIGLVIMLTLFNSCEKESGEPPCFDGYEIEWNAKDYPIIKVVIPGVLDYYEVKAKLFDDFDVDHLMDIVTVKTDTVILNAEDIDFADYQNEKQKCEIWLAYYE